MGKHPGTRCCSQSFAVDTVAAACISTVTNDHTLSGLRLHGLKHLFSHSSMGQKSGVVSLISLLWVSED